MAVMRWTRSLDESFTILGFRFPVAVGVIASVVLLASTVGATVQRNGFPALAFAVLVPGLLWSGQIWRLATWSFFELNGLSLIFSLLMLAFFGRDLCDSWGGKRFLGFWMGATVATGAVLCLVGVTVWPAVLQWPYLTAWPVVEALTIAWALTFPARVILFNFVLPVSGTRLIYVTLIATFIYALLNGFIFFLPHFLAMGLTWVYVRGGSPSYWWLRLKAAWFVRRYSRHLRAVKRNEPPTWYH